jgi:FlaA1/EpsC-like NDP-sugar epimerase
MHEGWEASLASGGIPARVLGSVQRMPAGTIRALQAAVDGAALTAALLLTGGLRPDLGLTFRDLDVLAGFAAVAVVIGATVATLLGLYQGRWRYGSFEEVSALLRSMTLVGGLVLLADVAAGQPVPLRAAAFATVVGLLLMGAARFGARVLRRHALRPSPEAARRVVVLGAGEGGVQAVTAMLSDPTGPYVPVALLDDDPRKARLEISGVPVRGTRDALPEVVRETGADTLLVAIPSADAALVRTVAEQGAAAGVGVRVLPPVGELFGAVSTTDIRPVTMADLLGRREIETDLAQAAGYLAGRRVLVTGAGGSIGSELCRQVSHMGPAQLVMLDRDESGLHAVQLSLTHTALLDDRNLVVADIRDKRRVDEVFAEYRPEVVFHAAALKHLPLLEQHPWEAVKTNVHGTLNVLRAASAHHVDRFVNVSTDKAADPSSVLGYSKRITERLTAAEGPGASGTFLSVRFGNVLGSRGSVLTTFRDQIANGGPVTVTHPDVTRYFMTIEEAVQLVIQAGALGRSGEALVLDMGTPVRIADVAQQLVESAEQPVDIVYTGLRPGEKLHEQLLGHDEPDARPFHPLVTHAPVPPLDPSVLSLLHEDATHARAVEILRWLVDAPAFATQPAVTPRQALHPLIPQTGGRDALTVPRRRRSRQ